MDKSLIKTQVKQAYQNSQECPDFLQQFKHEIQSVIDQHIPASVTDHWHVSADINILSRRSKENKYKVEQFLKLISEYIFMLVQAYENNEKKAFNSQKDLFNELNEL